jgi:hypothetical protein
MKNSQLQSTLAEIAEQAVPSAQIDLWMGMRGHLATSESIFKQGDASMKTDFSRTLTLRRVALVIMVIAIAFAILLVTPQGQALAQEILKYFTTVSQRTIPPVPTSVPVPTYTLDAALIPQPIISSDHQNCGKTVSPISSTFVCQLQDAQAKLGFVVKSFPARYVQASFHFLWIDQEHHFIQMGFSGQQAGYHLDQGLGDFPKDCRGCAIYQEAVQLVRVDGYQAEYAAGIFIFPDGRVDKDMVWNPGEPVYHLRWKENERWYSFTLSTDQFAGLKPVEIQAKMIQIAENLVSLDQGADQLTAGSQPSIKDSAGFTIKEPGLLPEGFQQVPDGSWSNLTTAPRVGMRYDYMVNGNWVSSLTLYQMLIPADDKTLRREFALGYQNQAIVNGQWVNENTDEEVQINAVTGYYLEGVDSYTSALYWRDAEREYLLIYQWVPDFGGRLDKATLIAIAESLK